MRQAYVLRAGASDNMDQPEAALEIPARGTKSRTSKHSAEVSMFTRFVFPESSLFSEVRRLEQELDDLLGGGTSWSSSLRSLPPGTFPAINAGSTDDRVSVYVFAPGIDPKSLDIQMQQNLLSIAGKREEAPESGATYYRQERFRGDFRRVLTLPDDVDPDKVAATYRDGIVEITVRRRESTKPRQIAVQ